MAGVNEWKQVGIWEYVKGRIITAMIFLSPGKLWTVSGVLSQIGVKNRLQVLCFSSSGPWWLENNSSKHSHLTSGSRRNSGKIAVLIFIAVGLSALDFGLKSAIRKSQYGDILFGIPPSEKEGLPR